MSQYSRNNNLGRRPQYLLSDKYKVSVNIISCQLLMVRRGLLFGIMPSRWLRKERRWLRKPDDLSLIPGTHRKSWMLFLGFWALWWNFSGCPKSGSICHQPPLLCCRSSTSITSRLYIWSVWEVRMAPHPPSLPKKVPWFCLQKQLVMTLPRQLLIGKVCTAV